MKRRNVDSTKNRKQFHFRKCKFTEGIVGNSSTFLYLKFIVLWILIIIIDYLLEFRFEFLWPFWLLIRSLHDSFKYQGIIFTIFFAFVAFLADFLFYMFLPVQWLFFAASTYVWVQYIWHTEKGICFQTVVLWSLFVYIEASQRLKSFKIIDICQPFAAHCIGYPMVTLGFGFKSYVTYKFRIKRQKEIQKLNEFYIQLIAKALPMELQLKDKFKNLKYEENISSHQTLSNSAQSSIFGALCNLKPFTCSSTTSSASEIQRGSFSNTNQNTIHIVKNKNCTKTIDSNQQGGLIASALSFYLNSNRIDNNKSFNLEDDPYIQQKDSDKSSKFHVETEQTNLKNNSDYSYPKDSLRPNLNNFNERVSYAKNNFIKSNKSQSQANSIQSTESSVNCKVSSFSISSLAYEEGTNQILEENDCLEQGSISNQSLKNNNPIRNLTSLNGNLLLSSNSKIGNVNSYDPNRSSSSSPNTSPFLSNSSNNHTNININMTINATAIAAATATATALGNATANNPKPTSGCLIGTTKNRKNKENSAYNSQRGNSVASSSSSSSSSSSIVKTKIKNDNNHFSYKDDLISHLEDDLKKFKAEIEKQKSVEQYLRSQMNYMNKCERSDKLKLEKIQQENKAILIKLNKANVQNQKDKEDLEAVEKRFKHENCLRKNIESRLAQKNKNQEAQESEIQDLKKYISSYKNSEKNNTDISNESSAGKCEIKLKEIEIENKILIEESRKKEEIILSLECDMKNMKRSRDTESRVDTLMVAMNLMEEKNASLQESLSAETRFKLDLFSALGEARRQLESVNFQLKSKERELQAFKSILKQSLTGSENLNNHILNNYLSASNESNQILSNDNQGIQSALSTDSHRLNTVNPNFISTQPLSNNQTEWNGTNGNLTFLPKI